MHLKNAKKVYLGILPLEGVDGQVAVVYHCWINGGGVFVVQLESGATTLEAHCREAAMISALGLNNIENKVAGATYGDMKLWSEVKLKNFGEMLLFLTFKSFIAKRPPVIRAIDVVLSAHRVEKSLLCTKCGSLNY